MRPRMNHTLYVKLLQNLTHKHYDKGNDKLSYDIMSLIHCEAEMLVLMTGTDKTAITKSIDMYIEAHCQHIRTEIWRRENDNTE